MDDRIDAYMRELAADLDGIIQRVDRVEQQLERIDHAVDQLTRAMARIAEIIERRDDHG